MKRKVYYYITTAALGIVLGLTGCGVKEQPEQPASATGSKAGKNEIKSTTAAAIESITYDLPSEAEEAGVYVQPIDNLSKDFIRGVDISSVIAQEESGVVYYNEDGLEQDIFETLAQHGVNYIRVRVWNDPYDADGNSYGGGNNDTATAVEIGRRAAKYNMKLCVDYHYSDFWADPSKQMCPKAWEGMGIEDKAEALGEFTKESLTQIIDGGAMVGMVQIGNEINNGMAGETDWSKMRKLLSAGSAAVREAASETGSDIQIAVHFTDINNKSNVMRLAEKLESEGDEIDYDIFAVSYYPFWHGTIDNLTEVMKEISRTYGKKVIVAENSYLYTTGDGDGSGNSVGEGAVQPEYPATVQGQASEIRDICAAVAAVGDAGLGYFYWEPAWIPVGVWEEGAADADAVLAENKKIWEEYGSGWASSYAGSYDPKDAGVYYGGSSWDNQALFDYYGHPLESLKVFRYLHCGTIAEKPEESISTEVVDDDRVNLIANNSFEESDTSMWEITGNGTDFQDNVSDAHSGDFSLHFWSTGTVNFTVQQTITELAPGTYEFGLYIQGGDADGADMYIYADNGIERLTQETGVAGWANWKNPVINEITVGEDGTLTVGVSVNAPAKAWGTLDDFYLYQK